MTALRFHIRPFKSFRMEENYGIMICNPPYGERIGEKDEILKIYRDIKRLFRENPTWSLYLVTTDKEFETLAFGRPADRRRKLYNGRLEVTYYQYYGTKPARSVILIYLHTLTSSIQYLIIWLIKSNSTELLEVLKMRYEEFVKSTIENLSCQGKNRF